MNKTRAELEKHYRDAVYVVIAETREIRFHVDEFSPTLDALLSVYNAEKYAFITACNPRSKILSAAENDLRHAELENLLTIGSFRFLRGYGTDKAEKWGREMSLLVINISEKRACETAKKFEQNAIVCGAINEKSRLVWVN